MSGTVDTGFYQPIRLLFFYYAINTTTEVFDEIASFMVYYLTCFGGHSQVQELVIVIHARLFCVSTLI